MCYEVYVDGSCKPNPGKALISIVLRDNGVTVHHDLVSIGHATNNVAEYLAFIQGVINAKKRGWNEFTIFTDSELVYNQLNGTYKVRNPEMARLNDLARKALSLVSATVQLTSHGDNLAHPHR